MSNNKSFVVKNGLQAQRYLQSAVPMGANDVDLSLGTYFSKTISGATTLTFSNPPASGLAIGFAVEINGDGSAITWPASVKWPAGTAPTATTTKEIYTFITTDGGTTYYGKQAATELV